MLETPPSRPHTEPRTDAQGLRSRALSGAVWTFLSRLAMRGADVIKLPILARLLDPKDFGTFGIALFVLSCLETFTSLGFEAALLHKSGSWDGYLGTVRTLNAIRGVILAAVIWLTAPLVADFFNQHEAIGTLQVIAFVILLRGLINPTTSLLVKQLDFRKIFVWQFLSELFGLIVGVGLAFWLRNAWALAFSILATQLVNTLLSYCIIGNVPKFAFDKDAAKYLLGYGRWILGSETVIFVLVNGDDALVGRVFGPAALGSYQMAYRIGNLITNEVFGVLLRVALPVFAELQNAPDRLRRAYAMVIRLVALLVMPLCAVMMAVAPILVEVVLGDKWKGVGPLLQILSVYGALRAINTPIAPVFQALGRPDLSVKIAVKQLLLAIALLCVLVPTLGVDGVAYAMTLALAGGILYGQELGRRLMGASLWDWPQACFPGIAVALVIWLATVFCISLMQKMNVLPIGQLVVVGVMFTLLMAPTALRVKRNVLELRSNPRS